MKKRILSILLAIVMVMALLPTVALAEGEPHHTCGQNCDHHANDPHTDGSVTWKAWNGTDAITYTNGVAYVYLSADAERSGTLEIPAGKTLYLCLNRHQLKNTTANKRVIDITGGTLNLTDCGRTGTITGGSFTMMGTDMTGSGVRVKDDGTFHMYGGTITGNSSVGSGAVAVGYSGSGVYSDGTFHMYGGTISNNQSQIGGGVFVRRGSFTMHDGTISHNTATSFWGGGGVYCQPDTTTFTMHGGSITGNRAGSDGGGGGVSGDFIMTGGSITGNTASEDGGGVRGTVTMTGGSIAGNTASNGSSVSGSLKISGSPEISGDVYLGSSGKITITGTLALPEGYQTIQVYSSNDEQHVPITVGASDYGVITNGEQSIFVSKNAEETRIHIHNGEVCQEGKPTVTFDANDGSPTPDTQTLPFEGGKATAPAEDPTRNGYVFSHWCDKEFCTDYTNCSGWNFDTVITESKTIYAIWESITVTITSEPGKLTAVTSHAATAYQWSTLGDADYPLDARGICIGTGYWDPTLLVVGRLDDDNWLPDDEYGDPRFNICYFNVYPDEDNNRSIPAGVLTVTLNGELPVGCVLKLMPYVGETVIEPISVSGNTYKWEMEENGDYYLAAQRLDGVAVEDMPSVKAVFTVPNGAFNPIDGETNAIFTNGENGKEYKVTATFEGGSEITSASEVFEELTVYTVTANPTEGGTVTVKVGDTEVTNAAAGETVTITATPNTGYEVEDIKVYNTGDENTTITVTGNQFTMPTYDVTVSVTFKEIPAPAPAPTPTPTPAKPRYPVVEQNSEDSDGTVSFSKSRATHGSTVTVTVTPDKYYGVEKVIVRNASGKEIQTTKNADGTYSFKMPNGKVTVEAVYVWENPFVDVEENTFYIDAVEWALKNGITEGTSETTFSPVASCTRAQMVTFLWRAAGCPEPTSSECGFADVDFDSYYGKAVLWALEKGITNGTSETAFSPDMECSRAQMAAFLCRMADGKAESGKSTFVDVNADAYYAEPVQWAFENGITEGTGEDMYSPDAVCTRGQIVTFLYRYFVK